MKQEFRLIVAIDDLTDTVADALYEAGFDDAHLAKSGGRPCIILDQRDTTDQTFVVQLAGPGTYLPTQRAVRGGSYSAIVESNRVGPEGGQVLVDKTVEAIDAVFAPRE